MPFFCQNPSKKRIKFQTFSQAWGIKPKEPKQVEKKTERGNPPPVVLQPMIVEPIQKVKEQPISLPQEKPQSPKSQTQSQTQSLTQSQEQTISMTTHLQIIKWLSLLYLINLLIIFIGFLFIWVYK
jgi:ATP-dependent Zn protease